MWTRREAVTVAIAAVAEFWQHGKARAQPTSAVATLCPTGKLRVALIASNPVLVTRRPDGGLGGVSVAVGRALAAHLGVPIELKPYDNPARYNESLAADDWDVGLAARDPSRAEHLVFSAAFMEVDNGYVARPGAAPTNADEVDRPGKGSRSRKAAHPKPSCGASSRMPRFFRYRVGSSRRVKRWRRERLTFTARICIWLTASPMPCPAHASCLGVSTWCKWRSECASALRRRFPPWMSS